MSYEPSKAESLEIINEIVERAMASGPQDIFTKIAYGSRTILDFCFFPTVILIPITTILLALLITISFGMLLLPLSIPWMLFLGVINGTSWLWIKVPILRPFIIIPGTVMATLGGVYTSLIPDMGEHYQKQLKMALGSSWPYSYLVWEISKAYRDQD